MCLVPSAILFKCSAHFINEIYILFIKQFGLHILNFFLAIHSRTMNKT